MTTANKSKTKQSKTGGRTKGALNKTSSSVKENILCVFTRLKGTAGMAAWAAENQTDFYRIYAKMLPKEIESSVTVKVEKTKDELLAAAAVLGMDPDTLFDEPSDSPTTH